MKTEILLFVSQFATIFLLGFQQQNVHRRHYVSAATTSLLIGVSNCFVLRSMPTATPGQIAIWLAAGPLAIIAAMWFHPKIFPLTKRPKS